MVLRFVVDVHTTCFGLHGHGNKSSEADSFRNKKVKYHTHLKIPSGIKSEISYTPEDSFGNKK
jgi:hypothetical protein